MKAMFLEEKFQLAFIEAATGKNVRATIEFLVAKLNEKAVELTRRASALAQQKVEEARADKVYQYGLRDALTILQRIKKTKPSSAVARDPNITTTFECGYDLRLRATSFYEVKLWEYDPNIDARSGYQNSVLAGYFGLGFHDRAYGDGCVHAAYDESFQIELKPQMGDDFPSVLRQMKNNGADTLVIGSFNASGATLEQVRAIFGGKKIITLGEIEKVRSRDTDR